MIDVMDKVLRPDKFNCDPSSALATKEWEYWIRTFNGFVSVLPEDINKLDVLINHLSPSTYELIKENPDFESALQTLKEVFVKPKNEVFARHLLATRKQQPGETLDSFYQALKQLSLDCNFKSVTAQQYKAEYIRDSFIAGMSSKYMRQRLLEEAELNVDRTYNKARALELAQKNNELFDDSSSSMTSAALDIGNNTPRVPNDDKSAVSSGPSSTTLQASNEQALTAAAPAIARGNTRKELLFLRKFSAPEITLSGQEHRMPQLW